MLWYIVVQIYISKSVPYFVPCFVPCCGILWYKYTLEKVGTSAKVGALEEEFAHLPPPPPSPPPPPPPLSPSY